MPSLAFLLPDPRLWSSQEVVIFTPTKNYTVHDYKEFFYDISFPEGKMPASYLELLLNYSLLFRKWHKDAEIVV